MEVIEIVKCSVMKGLGPDWITKVVTVYLDDIEPGTPEIEIMKMAKDDAKQQLKAAGYLEIVIQDIEKG